MRSPRRVTWRFFWKLSSVASYLCLEQEFMSDELYVAHLDIVRPSQLFEILLHSTPTIADCLLEPGSVAACSTSTTVENTAVCVEHTRCARGHVHFTVVHSNAGKLFSRSLDHAALELALARLESHFPGLVTETLDWLGCRDRRELFARDRFRFAIDPPKPRALPGVRASGTSNSCVPVNAS